MKYQSTQFGWMITLLLLMVLISMTLSYSFKLGQNPVSTNGLLIVGGILFLALLSFYRLKILVRDKTIYLTYGIGLIRIKIKPENITELKEIKIPFYLGLGTPNGVLYNIQGPKAFKLTFTKGKRVRTVKIGTPEPDALIAVIKKEFS